MHQTSLTLKDNFLDEKSKRDQRKAQWTAVKAQLILLPFSFDATISLIDAYYSILFTLFEELGKAGSNERNDVLVKLNSTKRFYRYQTDRKMRETIIQRLCFQEALCSQELKMNFSEHFLSSYRWNGYHIAKPN